ncbi:HinT-interacting membrane complex lipoprotein P60 [Mycoplasmopsis felifaucium]|uniref:HinT-interacting membrane complex lipoprotein P60 n=1 Tax=Mycoplasmopsis felifaucium TaxID=35768 RepID=UPI00068A7B76|nr:hypothetical protein [Mycoplasmopsis felifaucium]
MKKRNLLFLGSVVSPFTALISASCGVNIETPSRIEQFEFLSNSKRVSDIEHIWKLYALSSRYNLNPSGTFNESELRDKFNNEFKNATSELYKDSYKAFQLYANKKLASDSKYFVKKILEWEKNGYFGPSDQPVQWLIPNQIPSEDIFKKLWTSFPTGIQQEINNMLLVKAYFSISKLDELNTITKNSTSKEFQYYANGLDVNYDLNNYYLNRYAMNNKYIQLWNRKFDEKNTNDENFIFLKDSNEKGFDIKDINSFNAYFVDSNGQQNKKMTDVESLVDGLLKTKEQQIQGFEGFVKDNSQYNLNWNEEDMKKKETESSLYGVFDPVNKRLVSFDEIEANHTYVSTMDVVTNKLIVSYINQIVPIGGSKKITVAKDASAYAKDFAQLTPQEKEEVKVLSLHNTIYKDNLDKLSYLYYLNDSSLLEKAIEAFAQLGIKLKINKSVPQVYDLLKDKIWIDAK